MARIHVHLYNRAIHVVNKIWVTLYLSAQKNILLDVVSDLKESLKSPKVKNSDMARVKNSFADNPNLT